PEAPAPRFTTDVAAARRVIEAALGEGRSILTLPESKAVLAAFHIDIVPSLAAGSAAEAVAHARQLGFPVAMKILSPDISHKSDVNGVRLKLADAERVTATFDDLMASVARLRPEARLEGVVIEPMAGGREVMVGVAHDEAFGPTISFGLGGTLVELLQDAAVALPPLNHHLAADLISRSKAAAYLRPFRGEAPADEAALHELLLRVSALACELPWLVEMDLNPVMIDARGARAIDARLIVRAVAADAQPYAHLAIPPWPADGAAEPGSQS
ncbi:MAG: acetate--CoA ligase family protein, partial [Gammaproteobacteria bacterium]|nr:acetate--CoA ligase family protein [Gammaproteobacteria bacterium]